MHVPGRRGAPGPVQTGIPELTLLASGSSCRHRHHLSAGTRAGTSGRTDRNPTIEAVRVPDDPPIPPSVSSNDSSRLSPAHSRSLVERDNFGSASLYELFTSSGCNPGVDPVPSSPAVPRSCC